MMNTVTIVPRSVNRVPAHRPPRPQLGTLNSFSTGLRAPGDASSNVLLPMVMVTKGGTHISLTLTLDLRQHTGGGGDEDGRHPTPSSTQTQGSQLRVQTYQER